MSHAIPNPQVHSDSRDRDVAGDSIGGTARIARGVRRWLATELNWLFLTAAAIGLALRVLLVASPLGQSNSDEAVIYLMGRHAADGELRTFFWGQSYGGSALPDLLGLAIRVFGAHAWLLPGVELVLALLVLIPLRTIGTEIWSRPVGNVAAAFMWLTPIWVHYSVHDVIYMNVGFLSSLGCVALALIWRRTGSAGLLVLAGLAAGVGWWTTPSSLLITWPVAVLALRRGWAAPLLGVGVVIGAAPWLRAVLQDPADVFRRFPAPESFPEATLHAVTRLLPDAVFVPSRAILPSAVAALVGAAAYLAVAVACVLLLRRRRVVAALVCSSILLWPFFIAYSRLVTTSAAVRYVVFLLPGLSLLGARIAVRWRVPRASVVALLTACTVVLADAHIFDIQRPLPIYNTKMLAVIDYLKDRDRTAAWGTYWVAYEMTMVANETITVEALAPSRNPSYAQAAEQAPQTTIITQEGADGDRRLHGAPAERVVISGFAIYLFPGRFPFASLPPFGVY